MEVFRKSVWTARQVPPIVVTMEGTRPVLAEVQALVTPTMFGNAKPTTGLDFNKGQSFIRAVLEKGAGLPPAKIKMPTSNQLGGQAR